MGKVKDLTGQKFGRLTPVYYDPNYINKNGKRQAVWWCECDCGNSELVPVITQHLKDGHNTSCGCLAQNKVHSLVGKKFGRLTVIKQDENSSIVKWLCLCDCGNPNFISVPTGRLNNGKTQSCGCLSKELSSKRNKNI